MHLSHFLAISLHKSLGRNKKQLGNFFRSFSLYRAESSANAIMEIQAAMRRPGERTALDDGTGRGADTDFSLVKD